MTPSDRVRKAFAGWTATAKPHETCGVAFDAGATWAAKDILYTLWLAQQEGAIGERPFKVMDAAIRKTFGMEEGT